MEATGIRDAHAEVSALIFSSPPGEALHIPEHLFPDDPVTSPIVEGQNGAVEAIQEIEPEKPKIVIMNEASFVDQFVTMHQLLGWHLTNRNGVPCDLGQLASNPAGIEAGQGLYQILYKNERIRNIVLAESQGTIAAIIAIVMHGNNCRLAIRESAQLGREERERKAAEAAKAESAIEESKDE